MSASLKKQKKETLAESYARKVMAVKQRQSPSQKRNHSSPDPYRENRLKPVDTKKHVVSRFRSKSSDKRDHSLISAISKDDVMPCYKHKV